MARQIRFLTAFLLASAALAAAGEWTSGNVTVKHVIWIPSIKGFYAPPEILNPPVPPPESNNPQNCSAKNLYQIGPNVTDLEASRMLSMLLAAKSTGSPLNVYVEGCGPQGPFFTGLQVNP